MKARTVLALFAATIAAACSLHDLAPRDAVSLVTLTPANGLTGVDPATPVALTFSHPMMQGMEAEVVLHEGSLAGPAVSVTATWSDDRRTLTLAPTAPLKPATTYVVHLFPTLTSTTGQRLDHGSCARLGGQSVGPGMMSGGMMGGGMMGGTNGMTFRFTTA